MNHILFPITYTCNLSCKFCPVRNRKDAVDVEKCVNVMESRVGECEWVYITGGEPFLIEALPDICDRIRKSFKVGISTNGTVFRPEIANHADRIGISLDGDEEYHDSYRGQGVFDEALSLFQAIRDKCETVIMSTAFKENVRALVNLRPVVEKLNPTYWQVQRDVTDKSVMIPSII